MERLRPMLAVAGEPFDSPAHLFEIKWDGIRALAAVQPGGWQLWGREAASYTQRYPELAALQRLPPGTVLDGELVRLRDGRADFPALLRRHPLAAARKIRWAAAQEPVTYLVFDLLQLGDRCLQRRPLTERKARLDELIGDNTLAHVSLVPFLVGTGKRLFEQAVGQGHEGIMAKRLDSRYLPGQRMSAWQKIKPRAEVLCVIVGFQEDRQCRLRSLLVAALREGQLGYVGRVRCGLGDALGQWLAGQLVKRRCAAPPIACPPMKSCRWVRPELFCRVRSFGWTKRGQLRFACFRGLVERPADHSHAALD